MRPATALALLVLAGLVLVASSPAAFPGDNGRLTWASSRDGNSEIYSANPDGSGLTRLTMDPGTDVDPAWSADGAKIAFTSTRGGSDDIFVVAANGTGLTRLTTSPANDQNASWSPGGRNLAFVSNRDGDAEIFVMNEDGSGQTQLTRNDGASDAVPAWSPDGSKIAFNSTRDGNAEIYVMNVDGSGQTRLTNDPGSDVSANWSPDGQSIAFASDRDGNYEIYVMAADGSSETRVTTNLEIDLDPVWSPDGKQIAFTSTRDANYELYTMVANGSAQTRFTAAPAPDVTPDWQAVPITPQPPTAVTGAALPSRWHESEYRGRMVVRGKVPGAARLRLVLRRGSAVHFTTRFAVAPGSFAKNFRMPRNLLPGSYVLDVTAPGSSTPLTPQVLSIVLRAPPEGVVSRAWASDVIGGPAIDRLPSTAPIAWAHFRFAALPKRGRTIVAHWFGPGYPDLKPRAKPRRSLVIAFVNTKNRVPLPRGRWSCVLRAGPTVVKRLTFRIG